MKAIEPLYTPARAVFSDRPFTTVQDEALPTSIERGVLIDTVLVAAETDEAGMANDAAIHRAASRFNLATAIAARVPHLRGRFAA